MNSNKLLLITSEFPPQPGGIGNHAFNLAKELSRTGYEVQVLTNNRSEKGRPERDFDALQAFKIHRVARSRFAVITYLNRFRQAYQLTRHNEPIFLSGKFSLWMGGILQLFFKRKFIAILHGKELLLPNLLASRFTNYCLKRFEAVVAVSNYTKSLVPNLSLNRVYVIPNGFQVEGNELKTSKPQTLKLITVGTVTERKGQHHVIRALPDLLKVFPGTEYHIVGIPTNQKKLTVLALKMGVSEQVHFHGEVTDTEKFRLLATASVFVLLSGKTVQGDVEGFGIAILEANAMGIPAIGAKGCGIEDAVKDGYSGILIDAANGNEFIKAVSDIENNYQLYSINAVEWSGNFSWEKIGKQYFKILETG